MATRSVARAAREAHGRSNSAFVRARVATAARGLHALKAHGLRSGRAVRRLEQMSRAKLRRRRSVADHTLTTADMAVPAPCPLFGHNPAPRTNSLAHARTNARTHAQ